MLTLKVHKINKFLMHKNSMLNYIKVATSCQSGTNQREWKSLGDSKLPAVTKIIHCTSWLRNSQDIVILYECRIHRTEQQLINTEVNKRQLKNRQFNSAADTRRCGEDDDGGDAATTTGIRTPDCWPDDRFDSRRIVGVSPMITYRGVADDTDCHKPPARVDVPMSKYGGSRLNTIIQFLL